MQPNPTQPNPTNKITYPALVYVLLLLLYCAGMVAYSRYTFNLDDIWMWLEIYYGMPIFNGWDPQAGRFFPFASLDLNILMRWSKNPYAFFTFNACIVLCVGLLLWQISRLVCGESYKWLRVFALGLLLFHPGFATIMLGICYPERMQILFLLLFVWASMKFAATDKSRYAWAGFIAATIALYYKEPTFLFIGFFGVFGVVVHYIRHRQLHIYYASLACSALLYFILYCVLIIPNVNGYYGVGYESQRAMILSFISGVANLATNDMFLLILLPVLVAYRIYLYVRYRYAIHIIYDGLLFGSLLYVGVFIKMGFFRNYYILPMYFISFGGVIYFLFVQGYWKKFVFKLVGVATLVFYITNSLPQGITTYVGLKTEGIKFHNALMFIAQEAKHTEHINLYFDGDDNDKWRDFTWYWGYFDIYIKTFYDTYNVSIQPQKAPQSGDYIMLNLNTNKMIDSTYLATMRQKYTLIYESAWFGLPYIGLRPIIKYIFSNQVVKEITRGYENFFKLPLRDYIYKIP